MIPEFVAACGFKNAKAPGFETDDFLAAAAAKEEKRGGTVLIASGDRDTFQLASDRARLFISYCSGLSCMGRGATTCVGRYEQHGTATIL